MRQLDYDYPCDSTSAMGFRLVVVDDYSQGPGSSALRTVEELLVELRVARVMVRGNHAYWQGISGERGHAHGDALIVYRKVLVLKRFCGVWMTGLQTEWNIWMGGSARMGRGEAVMITMDFGISPGCYQVEGVKTLNYSGNSVVK